MPFCATAATAHRPRAFWPSTWTRWEAADASGFFVAPNVLATCNHVIAKRVTLGIVRPIGSKIAIEETVASDPDSDLALVRVDGTGPAFRLSDRTPKKGERLRAVTRFGVTEATYTGRHDDPDVGDTMLVAAPGLSKGASGGALIDATGAVVGIIRGAVDDDPAQVVAVPASRVMSLAASLK